MKPHMAYINNMLIRKQLSNEARNEQTSYRKYKGLVERAMRLGHTNEEIIEELKMEAERVMADRRDGDAIFTQGLANCKTSCVNAITLIISELKDEVDGAQ